AGHRIVEIGCVELINMVPTGAVYHQYINPERAMPQEAFAIHGLSTDFLSNHPTFQNIVLDFLDFIADDAEIVIHNASFDMKFLDWEIEKAGYSKIDRSRVVDTLAIARKQNPGGRNSLDALCKRYGINNSHREYHGALLDSQLLADVYLYLMGGRQPTLILDEEETEQATESLMDHAVHINFEHRSFLPSDEEMQSHQNLIEKIKNPKWLVYS
ncbi:MAG: DNA polymerase III subunit epsilon, partial [Alphaproteobacteria bacterium]|nr:DNA polymerase III subunit epsilon [Alphaproteobacteria bacterium]